MADLAKLKKLTRNQGIASSSDGAGGAMTFAHQADLNPQKTVKKRECICTIWNADPAMHTASRTGL
ncbi:hypothetical protein ABBQ38_013751 [Trebouxia sp. C0009 RCD-2024]